jgi:ribosome-associated translation inhibitor RaiA
MSNLHRMPDLVVDAHGRVAPGDQAYAHRKISALAKFAPAPILFAKVDLLAHSDPARTRGATAKGEIDVNGHVVRAKAEAATMQAAIDELESRLATRLKRLHPDRRHRGG